MSHREEKSIGDGTVTEIDGRDFIFLRKKRFLSRKIKYVWKTFCRIVLAAGVPSIGKLASLVALLISLHLIFIDFQSKVILIDEISASKAIQDMGFTGQVLASMLKDEIQRDIRGFHSSQEGPSAILPNELPSVTVVGTGLSVDAAATILQNILKYNHRTTISGSIISDTSFCRLLLWTNGQLILDLKSGSDLLSISRMISVAANSVLAASSPYYDALITYNSDRTHTVEKIDRIMAGLSETDENIPWLVSLKAITIMNDGKTDVAINYLRSYLKEGNESAVIHQDLAIMLRNQMNYAEASSEINKAIERDRANPRFHGYSGEILSEEYDNNGSLNTLSTAINELKIAVNHDRTESEYQYELAIALLKMSRKDNGYDFLTACKQLASAQAIDDSDRKSLSLTYIESKFEEVKNCISINTP